MPYWYQSTDWNEQIEADFFRRLRRARSHRPHYLVIQAQTLVNTGRPELAPTALSLIEIFFHEHSESYRAVDAVRTKARALMVLERWEEAFQVFEETLAARRAKGPVTDYCWLEYPLAIARRRARDRYQQALRILDEFASHARLVLPIYEFQYFATLALMSADGGDAEGASRWAKHAIAATTKAGPFAHHPDVGLVGMTDADLQIELEQLGIDYRPAVIRRPIRDSNTRRVGSRCWHQRHSPRGECSQRTSPLAS